MRHICDVLCSARPILGLRLADLKRVKISEQGLEYISGQVLPAGHLAGPQQLNSRESYCRGPFRADSGSPPDGK